MRRTTTTGNLKVVVWLKHGAEFSAGEPVSGLKKIAFDIANILSDKADVTVVGPGKKDAELAGNSRFIGIEAGSEIDYIIKSLKKLPEADILHCFSHLYYLFLDEGKPKTIQHLQTPTPPLLWSAVNRKTGKKAGYSLEEKKFLEEKLGNLSHWVNTGNQGTDMVLTCSKYIADGAAETFPKVPIKVLYNFIRLEEVGEPDYDTGDFVLYVGALVPGKGVDVIVDAAKILDEKGYSTPIYILGSSSLWLSDYDLKLQENVSELCNVKLLGPRDHHTVIEYMKKAALGLVPSTTWPEPFGLVAAEFQACGKPVIASSVGGLPEVVEDKVTGFTVPTEKPRQLAEKIIRLLENPDLRRRMGKAGRRRVERMFNSKSARKTYLNVYEKLLKQ